METNIFIIVSIFFIATCLILGLLFASQEKQQLIIISQQLLVISQQQKQINQLSLIYANQNKNSKTLKENNSVLQTIKANTKKLTKPTIINTTKTIILPTKVVPVVKPIVIKLVPKPTFAPNTKCLFCNQSR
jgi:hypothetical protein